MISRYSTAQMTRHFAPEQRFEYMMRVEIECALVQAEMGLIPKAAALDIRKKSKFQIDRILEIEKTFNINAIYAHRVFTLADKNNLLEDSSRIIAEKQMSALACDI